MFQAAMSNSNLSSKEANSLPSFNPLLLQNTNILTSSQPQAPLLKKVKKKRSLPGNPDPDAEVIALSPKSLLATNKFVCEVCNKGFQRDQNLQLHRRGHNLPWKLKQRSKTEVIRKKAYVCPEPTCVHHHPSRALGDLTGIKKHFCRKHGEKKYKCEKCSKIYAVQSDWKAHSKICGTREYRCDCGTLFSRKDSFITHRAFCDALAEESARLSTNPFSNPNNSLLQPQAPLSQPNFLNQNPNNSSLFPFSTSTPSSISLSSPLWDNNQNPNSNPLMHIKSESLFSPPPFFQQQPQPPLFATTKGMINSPFVSNDKNTTSAASQPFLSATALLQKAATVQAQQALMAGFDELGATFRHTGPTTATSDGFMGPPQASQTTTTTTMLDHNNNQDHFNTMLGLASTLATWRNKDEGFTRDFLGLTAGDDDDGDHHHHHHHEVVGDMLKFTSGLQYNVTAPYNDRDNSAMLYKPHHHHQVDHHGFGFVTNENQTTAASDGRWS